MIEQRERQMDVLIERLASGAFVIPAAVSNAGEEEARWKPPTGAWSLVEIVNHLADEEVDDFRTRLDLTLHRPDQDWPPIDPERAAIDRRYQDRDLAESIERFVASRAESMRWLRSLTDPKWNNVHRHPKGDLTTGDLLASWVAHDYLHLRQIAKRRYEYTRFLSGDFKTEYAGTW